MKPFQSTWARRAVAGLMALGLSTVGMLQSAQATLITTEQVLRAQASALDNHSPARARVLKAFDRDGVSAALQARGVDPVAAKARAAALTDAEAEDLLQQIDQAPAGAASVLPVLAGVFVILLVTDVLGFTRIFPFTRPIR